MNTGAYTSCFLRENHLHAFTDEENHFVCRISAAKTLTIGKVKTLKCYDASRR